MWFAPAELSKTAMSSCRCLLTDFLFEVSGRPNSVGIRNAIQPFNWPMD